MNFIQKLLFPTLVLAFASCSKNGSTIKKDPCNNIVEVLDYHPYGNPTYQTTALIQYDEQGRVVTVKGSGQNKSEYTYFNDRIELRATDIYGNDIGTIYFLDNAGRVNRAQGLDFDFRYNGDGYLISYRQPYGINGQITGYTQYYLTYDSGNLVEVYTNDQNVSRKRVSLMYSEKTAQEMMGYRSPLYLSGILGDRNTFFLIEGGFFGKQSKNQLVNLDFHNGYHFNDVTFQYDSKGRIITVNDGYSFKYQCP